MKKKSIILYSAVVLASLGISLVYAYVSVVPQPGDILPQDQPLYHVDRGPYTMCEIAQNSHAFLKVQVVDWARLKTRRHSFGEEFEVLDVAPVKLHIKDVYYDKIGLFGPDQDVVIYWAGPITELGVTAEGKLQDSFEGNIFINVKVFEANKYSYLVGGGMWTYNSENGMWSNVGVCSSEPGAGSYSFKEQELIEKQLAAYSECVKKAK